MEEGKDLEKSKKWGLKKTDPKDYGKYAFILIIIGYLVTKVDSIIMLIFGQIMTILGIGYFIMWIWNKFKRKK